jgi:hypothetical protein
MFEQLQQLAQCSDPSVSVRAQAALQIAQAREQGEISDSEYRELLEDLVRTDRLDSECQDLAMKTMLVTAVYAIAQVA